MELDENRLIQIVAVSKDRVAFGRLYDLCVPKAYGLAVRILKNEAEAEDVIQHAFIALWQNAAKFDGSRGQVTTWLYVFVRNRCIDQIRKKRKENHVPIELGDENREEVFDGWEKNHAVTEALKNLPDEQRSVIEAAYFEGLTQQEIAAKFDEPLGTIKTRMRLGMMKLSGIFKKEAEVAL